MPRTYYYRPYYTRWYCHPYYRYMYSTSVVVHFGFATYAWVDWWAPPARHGWVWVPGYWAYGYWHPGYWQPSATHRIVRHHVHYVYVPGWWDNDTYVDGYYRPEQRTDGDWEWIEGYYLPDGTYVRGHWMPTQPGPEGYVWEPGFWDGEVWVQGFWRPEYRNGYTWFSAYYDEDGIFHTGYWQPFEDQPGYVWIPGWFDGNDWQSGYWVRDDEYYGADIDAWVPEDGWDSGWEVGAGWGDGEVVEPDIYEMDLGEAEPRWAEEEIPLALPVEIVE